jgi:hypothetical protein
LDKLCEVGIACVIAAIVGGGLKAFGFEIPLLSSKKRQYALGILGLILCLSSLPYSDIYKRYESLPAFRWETASQAKRWEPYLGSWESDELEDPPGDEPGRSCVQNMNRKFYLKIVRTEPGRYAAQFLVKRWGSYKEPISPHHPGQSQPCPSVEPRFSDEHELGVSKLNITDDFLNVKLNDAPQPIIRFRSTGPVELEALPGGMETLLNNENLASLRGTKFLLYRRCATC